MQEERRGERSDPWGPNRQEPPTLARLRVANANCWHGIGPRINRYRVLATRVA